VRAVAVVLFIAGLVVQMLGLATSFLEAEAGYGYYSRQFDYRLGYNALAIQAELLLKYLSSPQPARIGLGFDRWFVFLAKAGVSHSTLWVLGLAMLGGAVLSAMALAWCACREEAPPASVLASSTIPG